MKAQQIRPKVHNGRVAGRSITRTVVKSSDRVSSRRRPAATDRGQESRVLWLIVLVGALLTAGFVMGLRSQINAHQLNQAEEKLRAQFDRFANEQRHLAIEQKRVISPTESERHVKGTGLGQVKFDERNALAQLPANSSSRLEPAKTHFQLPNRDLKKVPVRQAVVNLSSERTVLTRPRRIEKSALKADSTAAKKGAEKAKATSLKNKPVKVPKALPMQTSKINMKNDTKSQRQVALTSQRR